jgi:sugar lactone lactonase YvrE
MRRLVPTTVLAIAAAVGVGVPAAGTATADSATATNPLFPQLIALPDGWRPEGIATGRGTSFYVGSLADGAIYRGDLLTGQGSVLVPGVPGRAATGLEVDQHDRIFAAGAGTGAAHVYDAGTGATLASYQFLPPGAGFVNDVVVTNTAAYFTDSRNPVLYVLPFGPAGQLPAADQVRTLPLSGDIVYQAGNNANGIEATPDGDQLVIVQSNTGLLFSVSPSTGVARTIDLGGATLVNGDGLLRLDWTLYVVQNRLNQVAVLNLDQGLASAAVTGLITDPALDVPTTIAPFGPYLYAVNARFTTPPTPTTAYTVVRLPAR